MWYNNQNYLKKSTFKHLIVSSSKEEALMKKIEDFGDRFILFISYLSQELEALGYSNCKGELSPSHAKIIVYLILHEEEEVYQKTIEEAFKLRASTVSRSLKALEEAGYIERTVSHYDSRLKRLTLTEKTAKIRSSFCDALDRLFEKITAGIPEEKLDVLWSVIEKMKINFEKMN